MYEKGCDFDSCGDTGKVFKKVFIKAGDTKTVTADITVFDIGFYNKKLEYVVENGKFIAYVGGNSRDTLEKEFNVIGVRKNDIRKRVMGVS